MKKLWNLICLGLNLKQISDQVSSLEKTIKKLKKQRDVSDRELDKKQKDLENLESKLRKETDKTLAAIDRSRSLNKKLEIALEAAQEELTTVKQITIPGLVASNKTLMDRWEAESAIYVMRQAAANKTESEVD